MDKQLYKDYLTKKRQNPKLIDERMRFFDELKMHLKNVETREVDAFINHRSLTDRQNAYKFAADYVFFIEKEAPDQIHVSTVINEYLTQSFLSTARQAVVLRKKMIAPIPENAQIDRKYLSELTNTQFVHAFGSLQKCLIKAYDDVEQQPYEWGYPNFYSTDPHKTYNRVIEILFAFVSCGENKNGSLIVDAKSFFEKVKLHKKVELIITGLTKAGFSVEGFHKKADLFCVSYPKNPHVITVLCTYVNATHNVQPQLRVNSRISLSYRFIEDASTQKYEPEFLAAMDCASEKLYEIQMWLYGEAAKYGFNIDKNDPIEASGDAFGALRWGIGCILYKMSPTKNAKRFLVVGDYEKNGKSSVFARVVFNDLLQYENEMVKKLRERFPKSFTPHYCGCRVFCGKITYKEDGGVYDNCSSSGTWFEDVTLDDVKDILELFKVDRKIKSSLFKNK